MSMPFGYIAGVGVIAAFAGGALCPRPRSRAISTLSWRLGMILNEMPFIALWLLAASTLLAFSQGDITGPGGWLAVALAGSTGIGLLVVIWLGTRAQPTLNRALDDALGTGWGDALASTRERRLRHRPPLLRILFAPWYVRRGDVERVADIAYGDAGRANLLDVYRHRSRRAGGPVLVYFHGGGFVHGRKSREARPLLYRLASQGWTCVSANYRLAPARFTDSLIDAKRVIAWAHQRYDGQASGPASVFVAGSSAGAHLAAMAALTPNEPFYQPGFEDADTAVVAAICFYGYFGSINDDEASSPASHVRTNAPPFLIVQGGHDTFTPGFVEQARKFAGLLRRASSSPVVYAQLPGAQHAFDLVHSIRFDRVVAGVEDFAGWVLDPPPPATATTNPAKTSGATPGLPRPGRPVAAWCAGVRGSFRRVSGRARGLAIGSTVVVALASALSACGDGASTPQTAAAMFVASWNKNDWSAMSQYVDRAPRDFATSGPSITASLDASGVTHRLGIVITKGSTATAAVASRYLLPGVGDWTVNTTLDLAKRSGRWLVEWSRSAVDPALRAGSRLVLARSWSPRAPILGNGASLTAEAPMVNVGIEGSRITDRAAVSAALLAAGANADQVRSAFIAASAHPTYFEPVFALTEARFEQLGGKNSALYQIPGTEFQPTTARVVITPGLADHAVGTVGPITAEELQRLGSSYSSTSTVGQTGLEAAYQTQLAGRPGGTISVVDADGKIAATVAVLPPKPGTAVQTSIDPAVQEAAEAALAPVTHRAALVAVRASTGQVLAAVSRPEADQFDQALEGAFPPGSTFKVITAAALIEKGLTPSSPATCPPSVTIDGERFHNAEGDGPTSTMQGAFAESCNTAFINLARSNLQFDTLPAVAATFGIGTTPRMGLAAFGGKVPTPRSQTELAQTIMGQGEVVVSPLDLAVVAAAVDTGLVRTPRLVAGAAADASPGRPLPTAVTADLRQMMAQVAANGTAAGTGLPAGTHAKTGTAEYGTGTPQPTDAWLIGYRGDLAFAMVLQGTGNGGPTDGPIIARFLDALSGDG